MDSRTLLSLFLADFPNGTLDPCDIVLHIKSLSLLSLSCHFEHLTALVFASLFLQDKEGDTPLFFAVQNGHTEAATWLLDHNAYVDARNSWGRTPLFDAGTRELQKLLLEHGAKRNAKDFARISPYDFISANRPYL